MRQWPLRHFSTLANLLIESQDVDIALIGGPDEASFATEVQRGIKDQSRIHDLVGEFKLDELPYFLDTCALFVGNNSGPKHIAGGIGVFRVSRLRRGAHSLQTIAHG
jgi:ADP-heptose:LPS heptosyltransferase